MNLSYYLAILIDDSKCLQVLLIKFPCKYMPSSTYCRLVQKESISDCFFLRILNGHKDGDYILIVFLLFFFNLHEIIYVAIKRIMLIIYKYLLEDFHFENVKRHIFPWCFLFSKR